MSYIFIDESWDLWFDFSKQKTSKKFIVTCLFVKEKWPVEKIIKKIFTWFKKSKIKRHDWVLHCYKEDNSTRNKLFRLISQKEVYVMCIILDKRKVYTYLHDKQQHLYNYVLNKLLDRIFSKNILPWNDFKIIASRRETNKSFNENFQKYLYWQNLISSENRNNTKISVEIKTSTEEKCLQIVDALSWWLFKKYEHNEDIFYKIFENIVIEEDYMF